jgi:hypothetical protein
MQPIKLIIPGEYWDSQIYSRYLYLFGDSGSLTVIDWDEAIDALLPHDLSLKMATTTSFLESDLFYEKGVQLILQDPSIREMLLNRFNTLTSMDLQLDLKKIRNESITWKDNPLPFPHVDSEIYYNRLYVSLKDGVFYSECNGNKIKENSRQVWDTPTFDITASKSYTTIAFAAGTEGLFQQRLEPKNLNIIQREPKRISEKHCTSCKWTDFNIYATSHVDTSFFASFTRSQSSENKNQYVRQFKRIISGSEIFGSEGFSWGVQDKLYAYQEGRIDVIKYSSTKDGTPKFERLGELPASQWKGEVVSAEVAPFGTVIEFEDFIAVVQSNDEIITIPGEPVNWRVFSKSQHYTNQLHVIYEDRLEIFSFYNDYFVDQNKKISGIKVGK